MDVLQFGARGPGPKNALCGVLHRWRGPRKSFRPKVNKKSGVRHEGDLKRDQYVMPD